METTRSDNTTQPIEFLKSARDISFLFIVFLYYMGWIYVQFYLAGLGLTINAVTISFYDLLIYSSNVFIYLYEKQKLLILILIIAFIFISYNKWAKGRFTRLFPLFVVAMFPVAFVMAKSAGANTAESILTNPGQLQSIKFVFKGVGMDSVKNNKTLDDSLKMRNNDERMNILNQNDRGSFRLLVENDTEYCVLHYTEHSDKNTPMIYFIKKDKVEFVTIIK